MSMVSGYAQNTDSLVSTDTLLQDNGIEDQKLDNQLVYLFEIHDEIGPGATRITQSAIEEAIKQNSIEKGFSDAPIEACDVSFYINF